MSIEKQIINYNAGIFAKLNIFFRAKQSDKIQHDKYS